MTGRASRDDALERLVRAFEVGVGSPVAVPAADFDPDELAADRAALLARIRERMAEPASGVQRRAGLREVCLGLVRRGAVPVLAVLLVLVAVLPGNPAVLVLFFAVAPLALTVKWSLEAYRGAELNRHGARLRERSTQFGHARRRLAALAEAVDAAGATRPRLASDLAEQKVADFRAGLVAARDALADLAARLDAGSRGAQEFVADWPGDPQRAVDPGQDGPGALEPVEVAAALTDLVARLHLLGPMAADIALVAGGTGRPGAAASLGELTPGAIATELGTIHQEVARARRPVVEECRRLWSSFDTVHRSAARRFLRTRIRRVPVRAAALAVLDVRSLSTWSPQVRTRQRAAYLTSVDARPEPTFGDIGRAAGAMLRVG